MPMQISFFLNYEGFLKQSWVCLVRRMILTEVEQIIIAGNFIIQNKQMPRLALREVAERSLPFELALSLVRQKFIENLNDVMTLKIVSLVAEITFICF